MFPVSTGINRGFRHWTLGFDSVPRKYGDKPVAKLLDSALEGCSP
ncbi:conserved hypothetical protein [Xenorhabdus nematophila str. Websteri]|nr:conserved hypothetical protein [Xenorhabdus nematophila str. Websteri]